VSVYDNDEIGMSYEDRRALQIWDKSLKHVYGHFEMDIPFKDIKTPLPESRFTAERRLASLGKRLSKDPVLAVKYAEGMAAMVEKGYAEVVHDTHVCPGRVWYLPHQPVISAQKGGKVRIVFDCASKREGVSLNDLALQGPNLMNSLLGVLLRFRLHYVAFTADIDTVVPKGHNTATFSHNTTTFCHNIATYSHNTATFCHNIATYSHSITTYSHNIATYSHSTTTFCHNTATRVICATEVRRTFASLRALATEFC
jgi:hypothetical protein